MDEVMAFDHIHSISRDPKAAADGCPLPNDAV